MIDTSGIVQHMEIIGADGVHVGTVGGVESDRIQLTPSDRGSGPEHHFIALTHVADVHDGKVRLAFTADLADDFQDEI